MPISNWSTVAADNDDSDLTSGINLAEGQAPGSLNDSVRALMAVVKGDWTAAGLGTLTSAMVTALAGVDTAWTTYTPAIASSTTTITGTVAARYKKIGRTIHLNVYVQTSTGTGGALKVDLPVNAVASSMAQAGNGLLVSTGQALSVTITSGSSQLSALKYDGTSIIAPGNIVAISITYEAVS